MLNFKKIEIEDIDIFNKFMHESRELSCENAFVNLLVWQCTYNNMIAVFNGQLFIKSGEKGRETFRLPIGGDLNQGIRLINDYCKDHVPKFWVQEGPALDEFCDSFPQNYELCEKRDVFDYIYLRSDLATLSGKKYHSKRNHISAFSKKYDWHYEPITEKNIAYIKECAEAWYFENNDRISSSLLCEKKGVSILLDNMERLGVKGGAIFVEQQVVAFTLGSKISSECFDIHIEKALKNYSEAYAVINREFAKNELCDFKYINREDDMGLEGLRKAKLSYKPDKLLKKYHCYPRYGNERI